MRVNIGDEFVDQSGVAVCDNCGNYIHVFATLTVVNVEDCPNPFPAPHQNVLMRIHLKSAEHVLVQAWAEAHVGPISVNVPMQLQ